MPNPPVLLANWEGIVPVVIFLLFAARQYLEARAAAKQEKEQAAEPAPVELPPDREGTQRGDAGARGQDQRRRPSVESDVDDFLRKLNEQRQAEARTPRAEPREARTVDAPPGATPVAPSEPATAGRNTRRPPPRPTRSAESVTEHVRSHVDHLAESHVAENAAKLASGIAGRDDQMAARMRDKFSHRLGALGSGDQATGDQSIDRAGQASPAASIAAMLANPQGVRNAVLLNEILKPPQERW